jgi:hypothetical protein
MHFEEAQIHQGKLPQTLSEPNAYVPVPFQHSHLPKNKKRKKTNKNLLTRQTKMTRVMRTLRVKRKVQPVYRNHHPLVPEGRILVVHKRRELLLLLNKAKATPRTRTYHTCTCRRRRKSAVLNVATKKRHTPHPVCTALHLTLQMQKKAQSTK